MGGITMVFAMLVMMGAEGLARAEGVPGMELLKKCTEEGALVVVVWAQGAGYGEWYGSIVRSMAEGAWEG